MKSDANPMHSGSDRFNPKLEARFAVAPRCLARTRAATACQSPAVRGKKRCRMHGGASGSGAPAGELNGAWRDGNRSNEAIKLRATVSAMVAQMKAMAALVED